MGSIRHLCRQVLSRKPKELRTAGEWRGAESFHQELPFAYPNETYQHGKRIFWDVHDPERVIVIALKDERYDELIIEVTDPVAVTGLLQTSMRNCTVKQALEVGGRRAPKWSVVPLTAWAVVRHSCAGGRIGPSPSAIRWGRQPHLSKRISHVRTNVRPRLSARP